VRETAFSFRAAAAKSEGETVVLARLARGARS
jgi:hypothetical protein